MDPVTRLVHVLALAVYLGATVGLAVVFLPAVAAIDDPALQRRVLARGLRPYNVLSFGALLVALATGWNAITDLKAHLGPEFARPHPPCPLRWWRWRRAARRVLCAMQPSTSSAR